MCWSLCQAWSWEFKSPWSRSKSQRHHYYFSHWVPDGRSWSAYKARRVDCCFAQSCMRSEWIKEILVQPHCQSRVWNVRSAVSRQFTPLSARRSASAMPAATGPMRWETIVNSDAFLYVESIDVYSLYIIYNNTPYIIYIYCNICIHLHIIYTYIYIIVCDMDRVYLPSHLSRSSKCPHKRCADSFKLSTVEET